MDHLIQEFPNTMLTPWEGKSGKLSYTLICLSVYLISQEPRVFIKQNYPMSVGDGGETCPQLTLSVVKRKKEKRKKKIGTLELGLITRVRPYCRVLDLSLQTLES